MLETDCLRQAVWLTAGLMFERLVVWKLSFLVGLVVLSKNGLLKRGAVSKPDRTGQIIEGLGGIDISPEQDTDVLKRNDHYRRTVFRHSLLNRPSYSQLCTSVSTGFRQ